MSEIELASTAAPAGWDEYAGSLGGALSIATAGWLASQGSDRTREEYCRDVLGLRYESWQPATATKAPSWLPWCAQNGIDPLTARRSHVEAWSRLMEQAGISSSGRKRRICAASSWYAYLISEELTERNPARDASRPRAAAVNRAIALNHDDMNRFLDAARSDSPRTAALMYLMYFGAFRIGALLNATVGDYGWASYGQRGLLLHHKGDKTYMEPLDAIAVRELGAYLATRPGAADDEPLFATAAGGHLDRQYVWRLVRRLGRQAGIDSWKQMKAHGVGRATHITHARDYEVSVDIIADTVHHADPRTTLGYDSLRGSRPRSGTVLAQHRERYEAQRDSGVPS